MSIVREWAAEWAIPYEALFDLERRLGTRAQEYPVHDTVDPDKHVTGSESRQQSLVLLESAQKGAVLLRNNVGALKDQRGVPVRYGLANTSHDLNEVLKSSDLIGIEPVRIEQHHVGTIFGRFLSIEMKHEGWEFNPNDTHEVAQNNWHEYVISYGGRSFFCTGPGML